MKMTPYGRMVLWSTLALLMVVVAARAESMDYSAPEFVQIVNKPKTTSAEFQVQRLIGPVYEPCKYGHAVQYRLTGENHWNHSPITEQPAGRFMISGLQPGHQYEVRVACKDNKIPPGTGAFSTPTLLETPLVNPSKKPTNGQHQASSVDSSDDEASGSSGSVLAVSVVTVTTAVLMSTGILASF